MDLERKNMKSLYEQLKDGDEQIKNQKPVILEETSKNQQKGELSKGGKRQVDAMVRCPVCKNMKPDVEKRRIPTAYVDDERNFTTSCYNCYEEICDYWHEMNQDYINAVK